VGPLSVIADASGKAIYIACAEDRSIRVLSPQTRQILRTIELSVAPSGLALSRDGSRLFVTCPGPVSKVLVIDTGKGKKLKEIVTGHTAVAPVLATDERTLFICCQMQNCVAAIDLATGKERARIPVGRQPVAAALTRDGRFLLVANLLPEGRANVDYLAARISVVDTAAMQMAKQLHLPNGSGSLNDIRVSPDGKWAVISHIVARFHLPTTQLERGWMNTNAKTIIDLARLEVLDTVLLDGVESGAANPWGVAWSGDSRTLAIAHAGTHEVSVIDFPAVLEKIGKSPRLPQDAPTRKYGVVSEVVNDLAFLVDIRRRVKLPEADRGPRGVVVVGNSVFTANFFSDSVSAFDFTEARPKVQTIRLTETLAMDPVRKGKFYFHDASICFQGWQSCSSCHPGEARTDGLSWDLLNDGIGNPKRTKSLLLVHQTPPAMSMGVRESAESAVRAGIRNILFTVQPAEVGNSLDAYLKWLKPLPSPHLENGKLSAAASRGEKIFKQARCNSCHPGKIYTDLQSYDIGTAGEFDKSSDKFDTPTLIECWRTAPYLHDGSAGTIRDVLTTRNPQDQHGSTSGLSQPDLDDLCEFVLSL
jgi:DNA-binding beta-propeller fold protein YncE